MDAEPLPDFAPEACTLPTVERPLRMAEFDDVLRRTTRLDRIGPHALRLILAGSPDLAATVRALAARENQCCSFFTFGVTDLDDGQVRFDVEVAPAHGDVLEAMAAGALRARAGSVPVGYTP